MRTFIGIGGGTGVLLGCLFALLAEAFPAQRSAFELSSGTLVVSGTVLLGLAFSLL
jgi:hypothetical protein